MATEIRQLIDEGVAKLARVSATPRLDAEVLLAAALGTSRSSLHARAEERVLDCEATDRYEASITRRAHGEPVAYILGRREFWSLSLAVTPDVLIPRPETELVVERALTHLPATTGATSDTTSGARVLDLGSGSGAIALAIAAERPACSVTGIDSSSAACRVAAANARQLGIGNVSFLTGCWYEPVAGQRFDVIASNPPYVADDDPRIERDVRRYEPGLALSGGPDGLASLRAVIGRAPAHLGPGGWLVVEHGDEQAPAVRALMRAAGLGSVATFDDLAGRPRVTEGYYARAGE
jgi:release factor glutamine methyltransferase